MSERRYQNNVHVRMVEAALGHLLPPGAEVHHVNGDGMDNRNENFVACQDRGYHMLLEVRTRAFRACGNPAFRLCLFCKEWDDPALMLVRPRKGRPSPMYYHSSCQVAYKRIRRERPEVREKLRASANRYRASNRDKFALYARRNRARKKEAAIANAES